MYNLIDTHFHLDFYKIIMKYIIILIIKIYVLCVTNQPEVLKRV